MNPGKNYWLEIVFLGVLVLLSPLDHGGEGYRTALWLRMFILGFALYYFLWSSASKGIIWKIPKGGLFLLGLFLCLSASLIFTHYYYFSLYWYFYFVSYFLLFFLALNFFSEASGREIISTVWLAFLLSAFIESLFGIVQHFSFHPERVSGTFFNPAYYAGYLVGLFAFPLAILAFGVYPGIPEKKRLAMRFGAGILSGMILLGLIFSASRTIIFALIPLSLILILRWRYKALGLILTLILAVALIPNPFRTRILNLSQDPYAWQRVGIWKTSLKMIAHHPQGVGLGMYGYYYHRYAYPLAIKYGRWGKMSSQSHNEFLNFAAECSPLCSLFALGFLALLFPKVFREISKSRSSPDRMTLLAGFSGSLLGILGHSLVDFNLHQPPIVIVAILDFAGLIFICYQTDPSLIRTRNFFPKHPLALRWLVTGIAIGLACFLSFQTLFLGLLAPISKEKNPQKAIAQLYLLSRFPSGFASIYLELGFRLHQAFVKTKDPKLALEAISQLEHSIRLNPEDFEPYYYLAQVYYELGAHLKNPGPINQAKVYAQKAIQLAPGQVFSYLLLSNIYLAQENYPSAKQELITALEYEPYFFKARALLIRFLVFEKNLELAQKELKLLIQQNEEVRKFEAENPGIFNFYQKQIFTLSEEEINELKAMCERV